VSHLIIFIETDLAEARDECDEMRDLSALHCRGREDIMDLLIVVSGMVLFGCCSGALGPIVASAGIAQNGSTGSDGWSDTPAMM
jgi:hypothetical protein